MFYDAILSLIPLLVVAGGLLLLVKRFFDHENNKRNFEFKKSIRESSFPMRLQAYERIVLYLERISPENLLFRIYKPGMSAKYLQSELLKVIREEYDHNLTQQLYISSDAWSLVKKSKEEMIKIVHMSGVDLSADASGMDLSKKIMTAYGSLDKQPIALTLEFIKKEAKGLF